MVQLRRKERLRHLLINEAHQVDEVRRRTKDRLTVLTAAIVLVAEEVLKAGKLFEVARESRADVPDRHVVEAALDNIDGSANVCRDTRRNSSSLLSIAGSDISLQPSSRYQIIEPSCGNGQC